MILNLARIFIGIALTMLVGCTALAPKLNDPDVKLVGLRMLPAEGLLQRIAVDLVIANPNKQDLSINGISYKIGIENISVLSGLTRQVPLLKSYEETPVTLEVSADLIQVLRLIEHFSHNKVGENVHYHFSAVIDFSSWLPSMRVDKKGMLPLGGKKT